MKTLLISILFLAATTAIVNAQSPVPDPDTLSTVKQTDPEPDALPPDANYREDAVKITPAQLPRQVQQALESGTQYEGWQKGVIYKSKRGNEFTIEVTRGDTAKIFRFDQAGRPVND